jgi:hypothetical protein
MAIRDEIVKALPKPLTELQSRALQWTAERSSTLAVEIDEKTNNGHFEIKSEYHKGLVGLGASIAIMSCPAMLDACVSEYQKRFTAKKSKASPGHGR